MIYIDLFTVVNSEHYTWAFTSAIAARNDIISEKGNSIVDLKQ